MVSFRLHKFDGFASDWGGAGFLGHEFTVKPHDQGVRRYGRRVEEPGTGVAPADGVMTGGRLRGSAGAWPESGRWSQPHSCAILRNWLLDIFIKMLQSLLINL